MQHLLLVDFEAHCIPFCDLEQTPPHVDDWELSAGGSEVDRYPCSRQRREYSSTWTRCWTIYCCVFNAVADIKYRIKVVHALHVLVRTEEIYDVETTTTALVQRDPRHTTHKDVINNRSLDSRRRAILA